MTKEAWISPSMPQREDYSRRINKISSLQQEPSGTFQIKSTEIVQFPWIKKFVDHRYKFWAKLIWFVAILTCASLSIWQVLDRYNNFSNNWVGTKQSIVRKKHLTFPSVTICPPFPAIVDVEKERPDLAEKLRKQSNSSDITMWDIPDLPNEDAWTLWDILALNTKSVSVYCDGENNDFCDDASFIKSTVYTYLGKCVTVSINGTIQYHGFPSGIWINIDKNFLYFNDPFVIVLHELDESPVPYVLSPNIGVYPKFETCVLLGAREFHYINASDHVCMTPKDVSNCYKTCIDKVIAEKAPCRMPYTEINGLEPCSSSNSLVEAHVITAQIIYYNYRDLCGHCPRKCIDVDYTVSMFFNPYNDNSTTTYLRILFQSNSIDVSQEYIAYNLVSLLCDVGGTLGLFLGFCVLTVLETVENLIVYIKTKFYHPLSIFKK